MGATNSNLNETGFTYDLVTSMTQKALNSGLKDVLNATGADYGPIVGYYKKQNDDGTGPTVEMTAEEVQQYITDNDVDIFAIPNGDTSANNPTLAMINSWEIFFVGGMKATIGTPQSTPPSFTDVANAPNIITLQSGSTVDVNQSVLYDIYFKTFQVTEITIGRTCSCTQYIQDSKNPFQFTYTIDLNIKLTQESYNNLPEYMKTSIQNVINDPSTMFSLQFLLLDLNTIKPYGIPQTTLPADSQLGSVFNVFVTQYWTPMTQNGDIVFASSASPAQYPIPNIIPTNFNFMVSPYIPSSNDQNLSPTDIANLSTLNYLVMTNGHNFPSPLTSFNWNWVDAQDSSISGIMSAKRDILEDNLNDLLSPLVQSLCFTVTAESDLSSNKHSLVLNNPNTNQKYLKTNNNGTYLTFNFSSEDDDHSGFSDKNNFIKGQVNVDSEVSLVDDIITVAISAYLYTEYSDGVSKTYGWPLAQTVTAQYQLDSVGTVASDAGSLNIKLISNTTTNHTQTTNKDGNYYNGDLDPSIWAEITTIGNVDDVIDGMLDQAATIETSMSAMAKDIESLLNSNFGFVFPGAKTYFFANPKFSIQGDLTVEVSYQSVN